MEATRIALEEIKTYGYCPLQHHLRFNLELPWFPATAEAAFSLVMRAATETFLHASSQRVTARMAETRAFLSLKRHMKLLRETFPAATATANRLATEGHLALTELTQTYKPGKDAPIGYRVPADVSFETEGHVYIVSGEVDVLYRRNHGLAYETVVAMSYSYSGDPHEHLPKWEGVRRGFVEYLIRSKKLDSGYRVAIEHIEFPIIKPQFHRANVMHTRDFRAATKQVADARDAGYRMPTGIMTKCGHCPYEKICSLRLATVEKKDAEVDDLKQQVMKLTEGNKFFGRAR